MWGEACRPMVAGSVKGSLSSAIRYKPTGATRAPVFSKASACVLLVRHD
jgi:hypothetical protein